MGISKLAIAVTFYYVEERLQYLSQMASQFHLLADDFEVHIFTHEADSYKHHRIMQSIGEHASMKTSIHVPTLMGHPYLLTWSHLTIFREKHLKDLSITHFMYLEDDIYITPDNISYWLNGREKLRPFGAIPSFLRYEINDLDGEYYCSDVTKPVDLYSVPTANVDKGYCYLSLPEPYQGMYLLDRELMEEHLSGPSSIPEYSPWGIREKAAAGVSFLNMPNGCHSRNLTGYDLRLGRIDTNCLIHHIPNNYTNTYDEKPLGRIKICNVIEKTSSAT